MPHGPRRASAIIKNPRSGTNLDDYVAGVFIMRSWNTLFVMVAVSTLCAACTVATEDGEIVAESPSGTTAATLVVDNHVQLQGVELQGIELQGIELQGIELQGIELQGIELQGVELQGTDLTGIDCNGDLVSGSDFVGSTMVGVLSNDESLTLRIDAITPSADPAVGLFTVSYHDGAGWKSLCGESDGAPVKAIPLMGRWDSSQGTLTGGSHIDDPTMFTFACRTAVLAKCVEMGYKPWDSVAECHEGTCTQRSLRHFHQACTRMMRADYCGDGMPHTQNGRSINVWDNFDIQERELVFGGHWKREAEWEPTGAMCIKKYRWDPGHVTKNYVQQHCQERKNADGGLHCFDNDSPFFTEDGFSTPMSVRVLLRNEAYIP